MLEAFDGLLFADLAVCDRPEHGLQLVKVPLPAMHLPEHGARKGPQLLGRFAQPVQDRIPTVSPLLPPIASRNVLLLQSLSNNTPYPSAKVRRRKDEHPCGHCGERNY